MPQKSSESHESERIVCFNAIFISLFFYTEERYDTDREGRKKETHEDEVGDYAG